MRGVSQKLKICRFPRIWKARCVNELAGGLWCKAQCRSQKTNGTETWVSTDIIRLYKTDTRKKMDYKRLGLLEVIFKSGCCPLGDKCPCLSNCGEKFYFLEFCCTFFTLWGKIFCSRLASNSLCREGWLWLPIPLLCSRSRSGSLSLSLAAIIDSCHIFCCYSEVLRDRTAI